MAELRLNGDEKSGFSRISATIQKPFSRLNAEWQVPFSDLSVNIFSKNRSPPNEGRKNQRESSLTIRPRGLILDEYLEYM